MHRDWFKLDKNMAVVLLLSYGLIFWIPFTFNYTELGFSIRARSDYAYDYKFACLEKKKKGI